MRFPAAGLFIIIALVMPYGQPRVLADGTPPPAATSRLSAAYQGLWDKLQAKSDVGLDFRTSLQRRITWGSDAADAKRSTESPGIAAEKDLQEKLDERLIDAVVSGTALPISSLPGSREALLSGKVQEPVS